uniref:UDP-D-xylose:beta-D-glucoside alpha-1,3-D-xylosyltransferase n=1 Tax=Timema tahoe TaxID=61484 RepID=A0A7R9INZ9_9NEOP|nr:unnamed protein product [Timema tahoe]
MEVIFQLVSIWGLFWYMPLYQCHLLHEWRTTMNYSFVFDVLPITFPLQGNPDEWRRLFKPCASQRLFLPAVLADIDSLLYVDTDTLFLGPLEDVWHHFELMNSSQIAALTPEHEDPNTGWYNRFARHPYYGKLGVNSGVMLMNLTRMRLFSWTDYVAPIYKEYKLTMTWGDQDIINIIFHFHPGDPKRFTNPGTLGSNGSPPLQILLIRRPNQHSPKKGQSDTPRLNDD